MMHKKRKLGRVQKKAMVSHGAANMSAVKDPTEGFSKGVRWVERAGDVL
jgi:hypothetical protein